MPKYKLKEGDHSKTKIVFRMPKKQGMVRVVLSKATQAQLAILHALGNKKVVEVVEEKKKPASGS